MTEENGQGSIQAALTDECRTRFADLSDQNVGREMVLVVDGVVISAPVVRERSDGGMFTLSPQVSVSEAAAMLKQLSAE